MAYISEPMWDRRTVRNTRQGRSIKSIQAQVDRATRSTFGTDTYYKNIRRLEATAQRYNRNIRNEMYNRSVNNPNALNYALSQQLRDSERESLAMVGRNVYDTNYSHAAQGGSNG